MLSAAWRSTRLGRFPRLFLSALILAVAAAAEERAPRSGGAVLRLPVTRDTWFSSVPDEADCNLGGAGRLKLKSYQEVSLIDFDPAPLRGRTVRSATLHLQLAGEEILHRVTAGTIAADWVEGTSTRYAPQAGSSSYRRRRHPDLPWAYPESLLNSVLLGAGGTIWRMADATPPDRKRWQRLAVDPAVIAARVAGISYGIILADDTGTEWRREGEQVTIRRFPNRFVRSRDADVLPALPQQQADPQGRRLVARLVSVAPR
jgi:hypothetical protein